MQNVVEIKKCVCPVNRFYMTNKIHFTITTLLYYFNKHHSQIILEFT